MSVETNESQLEKYGRLNLVYKLYDEMTYRFIEQDHNMDIQVSECLYSYFSLGLEKIEKDIWKLEDIIRKG